MNRFWNIDEFNRIKKNPFEHNFFPFYEFLAPETEIMVQFLEPETDVMVQFLAPEIVIMGQIYYILMVFINGYVIQRATNIAAYDGCISVPQATG